MNIENLRKKSELGLNTGGKFLLNQQTGNTDKVLYSASSLNSYKTQWHEYIFIGNLRYGESFGQKDTEDGSLHLRYTQKISENHFAEIYTQYEYNNFKALVARRLIGLGHRYTMGILNIGVGAFDEIEAINPGEDQNAIRGNMYLSSTWEDGEGLELSTIFYYQPSLKRGNDVRTTLNTALSKGITKNVSMLIEYQNVFDQNPPVKIKKYDSSLMFGFNFK